MSYKRKYAVKKKLSGSQSYRKWEDYSEGDVVVGEFVGIHTCQYDKQNPKIKVLEADFKDGSGEDLVGKTLVLNSCGSLDKAMEEVEENDILQVEYTGKIVLEKGPFAGKTAHTMEVSICEADEEEEEGEEAGL
jgi:hypothetical protein